MKDESTVQANEILRGLLHVEARKSQNMTQRELSANTGVPVMWISRLEKGAPGVPPKYARAVAKALGLPTKSRSKSRRQLATTQNL